MSSLFARLLIVSLLSLGLSGHAHALNLDRVNEAIEYVISGFQSMGESLPTLGHVGREHGAPMAHGMLSMHQGKLVVVFAPDSGHAGGGFAFFDLDLADPLKPQVKLVKQVTSHHLREAHGYGYHHHAGRQYAALQSGAGVQFWDWTDVHDPKLVKILALPGIEPSDYIAGAWWVFWQAPYVYVGGSSNGLYIVDARDVTNPKLVNRIAPSRFKLDRVGPVFAVGNRLVMTNNQGSGIATADISDPVNPRWIDTDNSAALYSGLFNGGRVYVAGLYNNLHILDVKENGLIRHRNSISIRGRGGYLSIQDGFAHVGSSGHYAKIDVRDPDRLKFVAHGSSGIAKRDEDFATALGPYVLIGDDHGNGSYWVRHAKEDDRTPPVVNMVSPANGAVEQALTARIGLTFTDQIDAGSANETTMIVRPRGGAPLRGYYSSQTNTVNFSPAEPLSPDTVYEIEVAGVRDYWGNPSPAFKSTFSTGGALGTAQEAIELAGPDSAPIGRSVSFAIKGGLKPGQLFTWDFGDGRASVQTTATTMAASFAKAGHYLVTVKSDAGASVISAGRRFVAHHPLPAGRPTQASTLAMDEARDRLFNVNPDQDTVTATSASKLAAVWEMPAGSDPKTLAVDRGTGRVWVASSGDDTIRVLEGGDGSLAATIALPFGAQPFGIAATPDGSRMIATLMGRGEAVVIDAKSMRILKFVTLGPTPRGLAISADGRFAYVARFISPSTHGQVYKMDIDSGVLAGVIPLRFHPGPDTEASGRGVPNYLGLIGISPDGRGLFVPSKKDNIARGLKRDGLPLTFESSVRAIVSRVDLDRDAEDESSRVDLNDRDMPLAVAFTPLGDTALVSVQGSNTVNVLDAYRASDVTSIENVGLAPQGLVVSEDGRRLYAHSFLSRQVLAYDISRLPQVAKLREIPLVAREKLPAQVLLGKQVFYNAKDRRMSRDGYISCASCHLDGGEDGRVWDFTDRGEGLRNTITLRGRAGLGHGRVHWTANFDEIQDFENDIRGAFGGDGFMTNEDFARTRDSLGAKKAGLSAELDALAAYVTSLSKQERSPHRAVDGSFTEAAMRGAQVFERMQCARCHAGASLTDSGTGRLHDVGSAKTSSGKRLGGKLEGFDTPGLQGLWATPPYLHDGSARSLRHLFDGGVAGLHGEMGSRLKRRDLEDLLRYLVEL